MATSQHVANKTAFAPPSFLMLEPNCPKSSSSIVCFFHQSIQVRSDGRPVLPPYLSHGGTQVKQKFPFAKSPHPTYGPDTSMMLICKALISNLIQMTLSLTRLTSPSLPISLV